MWRVSARESKGLGKAIPNWKGGFQRVWCTGTGDDWLDITKRRLKHNKLVRMGI